MPAHPDDVRLAKQMLAGSELAFERFFEDNFARLYRFARPRLPDDPGAARDVVQETMSRAVQKMHTYKGEASMFTWLCAICRRKISDFLARQQRYREHIVLVEDRPEIRAAVESFEAPASDDPEATHRRTETLRLIQVALDRLPPKYGNVLEWKYIEGHSVKEIAARLDIGVEAAQSLLARAKRAFADVYVSLGTPLVEKTGQVRT